MLRPMRRRMRIDSHAADGVLDIATGFLHMRSMCMLAMRGLFMPVAARMGGGTQIPATVRCEQAAEKMYGPITEGLQADDPDIAFVRAMIAQRQGAIELAKVRLQNGKNEQTRKWADDTIQRQHAEIDEMQAWLKKQVK